MGPRRALGSLKLLPSNLLFLCLCLVSVEPGVCQGDIFSIEGRVRTEYGQNVPPGTTVRLEVADGTLVGQQPVGPGGRFEFDSLPKKNYTLIATAEGFQPAQREIDVRHLVTKLFVELILSTPTTKRRHSALLLQTDSVAPKGARKEYKKGEQAFAAGDLPGAEVHFENAVVIYPCYARAQTDLASVESERHELPQAESALRKAIECDPAFLDAYFRLGILLNAERKFNESLEVLQDGLRRSPDTWQLRYELAVTLVGLAKYPEAEKEYLKTISLNPQSPPGLHAELANLYVKVGEYAKAYMEMEAYLRIVPDGPLASDVRETMQKMEGSGVLHTAPAQNSKVAPTKP